MTLNPILRVLSTFRKYRVKCLLIGGQACIIYGAAEFSRDSDFVILCTKDNLELLKKALDSLEAVLIYVPPLEAKYLERGHACHFRCAAKDVENLRIDVISQLRGCGSFDELWKRKNTITLKDGSKIDVIELRDLVQSKKTQRDKDWFMLRRLVENDIILHRDSPSKEQVRWWLCESRNARHLMEIAEKYPRLVKECMRHRPLLSFAISADLEPLESGLKDEELLERQKDIEYWIPLRKELEMLRHKKQASGC